VAVGVDDLLVVAHEVLTVTQVRLVVVLHVAEEGVELVEAAGVKPPPDIDAQSFLPTLRGETSNDPRTTLYWVRREGGPAYGGKTIDAVRQGDWKLLQDSPFAPLELYNLKDDPKETNNLAQKQKDPFRQLSAALRKQIQQGGAVPWQAPEKPGETGR
jgi:arylsulfatase A-like enzyme